MTKKATRNAIWKMDRGAALQPPPGSPRPLSILERHMKLSIIAAMVLTYTLLTVAWLCYADTAPL